MTEMNVGANSKITDCLVANPIKFLGKRGLFTFKAVWIATTPPTKKDIKDTIPTLAVWTKDITVPPLNHFHSCMISLFYQVELNKNNVN